MSELARELARTIEGEVRFDRPSRLLYSTDASIYQIEPLGVVIPKHRGDAEQAMRLAAHKLPLRTRFVTRRTHGTPVNLSGKELVKVEG